MTSLLDVLEPLALAIIPPAVSVALFFLSRITNISITDAAKRDLQAAALQGANLAYGFFVKAGTGVDNPEARRAALRLGTDYVQGAVPEAIDAIGKDEQGVRAMVEARLGGLLAADPAVTVAPIQAPAVPKAASNLFHN